MRFEVEMKFTFLYKGPSIKDISPISPIFDPPSLPLSPQLCTKSLPKMPFFLPPSLPLRGDVFYGWSLIERSFIIFVMKFRSMTLCWKERHEGWNIYVDICMDLLKIVKYIWYLITLVCLLDLCIRELVHEFKKAAARHMMCLGYILMGFVIDHIHPSPASFAKVPKKWTFYTRKLPPPS